MLGVAGLAQAVIAPITGEPAGLAERAAAAAAVLLFPVCCRAHLEVPSR
ncbi:MAG: hypothetical protein V7646_1335 [Pseudonocardia sp.]